MTESRRKLSDLFAACWKDDALKARLMEDPKAVLAEHGLPVPDSLNLKVVANDDTTVHITLPAPPTGHLELSNEELTNAAGGVNKDQVQVSIGALWDQGPSACK